MRYPVMGEPPVLDGTVQERLMIVCPDADALSNLGAVGAVAVVVVAVVASSTLDAGLSSPPLLLA